MGKHPNLLSPTSPSFASDTSEKIQALLSKFTMSQKIWPDDFGVSNSSGNLPGPEPGPKGDNQPSQASSSSKPLRDGYNFGTVDSAVVVMGPCRGNAVRGDYLKKGESSKETWSSNNNSSMSKSASEGNKKMIKYSREFLLSIKELVKDKPFQGEIQYPCVLRTHIEPPPPRVLRSSRNANGYPARFYNNNNGYGGQVYPSGQVYPTQPPPLLPTPWWLPRQPQPASPPLGNGFINNNDNNNFREQQYNEQIPPLFGPSFSATTLPARISRQPRPPELRTAGYAFPVSTTINKKKEVQPTTGATNENGVQNQQKLFQPHILGTQQVQDLNAKRCIVPLRTLNKP